MKNAILPPGPLKNFCVTNIPLGIVPDAVTKLNLPVEFYNRVHAPRAAAGLLNKLAIRT